MYKDLQMKGEKDWFGQMLSDQRSGSVVGELVRSVIIAGRGGGKGWEMMNNDFIILVYDRNNLYFSDFCVLNTCDIRCLTPDIYQTSDVWHQTSDIKHQTSETRHRTRDVDNKLKLDIRNQTFDIWRLISEVKRLLADFWCDKCMISDVTHVMSDI